MCCAEKHVCRVHSLVLKTNAPAGSSSSVGHGGAASTSPAAVAQGVTCGTGEAGNQGAERVGGGGGGGGGEGLVPGEGSTGPAPMQSQAEQMRSMLSQAMQTGAWGEAGVGSGYPWASCAWGCCTQTAGAGHDISAWLAATYPSYDTRPRRRPLLYCHPHGGLVTVLAAVAHNGNQWYFWACLDVLPARGATMGVVEFLKPME